MNWNPFHHLDNALGPFDVISAGIGTARQMASGVANTEQIAVNRASGFNTATCRAILEAEDIALYEDTIDGIWFYFRVPDGSGRAAIAILRDYGADAVLRDDA